MNLLLDTHVFLWWMLEPSRLDVSAVRAIASPDNRVYLSAASAWEIAIKHSLGKLGLPGSPHTWLPEACERGGVELLPILPETALRVRLLPWHHRDPFDRLLVAQVQSGFTLVTHDLAFSAYDVERLPA